MPIGSHCSGSQTPVKARSAAQQHRQHAQIPETPFLEVHDHVDKAGFVSLPDLLFRLVAGEETSEVTFR